MSRLTPEVWQPRAFTRCYKGSPVVWRSLRASREHEEGTLDCATLTSLAVIADYWNIFSDLASLHAGIAAGGMRAHIYLRLIPGI